LRTPTLPKLAIALGWQAGVLVAALVTPILLAIIGWRGMFLAGLVPSLVAFVVRLYVQEPQIFLDRAKQRRTAMPLGLLVKDTATRNISDHLSVGYSRDCLPDPREKRRAS